MHILIVERSHYAVAIGIQPSDFIHQIASEIEYIVTTNVTSSESTPEATLIVNRNSTGIN
jgi:hypothetical protein